MTGAGGPRVVLDWLRACRTGGVHLVDTAGTRFVGWPEVLADVEAVAAHLRAQGVRPGDRVGVRGHNSYPWLVADLALLDAGAVPVAIPVPDFRGQPNAALADRYGLVAMLADRPGRSAADEPGVLSLERLLELPPLPVRPDPPAPAGQRLPPGDEEVFTVAFSSGTAGRVKCLLLAWPGVQALVEALSGAYPLRTDDRIMVALPLSTFQQRYLCYVALFNRCDVVLTTAGHFLPALAAARPTFLLGPPSFYEFAETRYANLGARRRRVLEAAAAAGVVLPTAGLRRRWRRRVFRDVHASYGGAMRLMLVGSAPTRPGTLEFFDRTGFSFFQIYGMTETGYLTWNRPGADRRGSVGRASYPGTVFLGADGEVQIRHPWHLCVGYEGETAADVAVVFRGEQTIATGDLGEFDSAGYLHLRGRKKNVLVTTGGQKIQLEDLEAELGRAAGVGQAVLYETDAELALVAWYEGDPAAVRRSLGPRVEQVNTKLSGTRIDRFALVEGVLEPGSALLNRNLKVDRAAVRAATEATLRPLGELTGTSAR